ncbi:MAG: hypothetical protein QOH10_1877 [Actinomycetota bacterium]|nr:hypothetical protein [Actinomycetota bacterium]
MPEGGDTAEATSSDVAAPTEGDGETARPKHLLLDELSDRLDTLRLIRTDDEQRADAILEQFGAKGKVESEMLDQLAAGAPLAHPDRFEEAHRTMMRALEVFDRNAARPPSNLNARLLEPVAAYVVQLLIRLIVRDYQKSVVAQIRQLYARRWAESPRGSTEFGMLRLARVQVERLAPDFQRSSLGVPTFLLGGAALSGVASLIQEVLLRAAHNRLLLLIVAGVFAALALGGFWCILKAAAIARRRTRIALDQPLRALWETIGAAGHPPKDQSRAFATYAVILLVLGWIVVPVAVTYAIRAG